MNHGYWVTDSQLNSYYNYWLCEECDLISLLNTMWIDMHFARLSHTTQKSWLCRMYQTFGEHFSKLKNGHLCPHKCVCCWATFALKCKCKPKAIGAGFLWGTTDASFEELVRKLLSLWIKVSLLWYVWMLVLFSPRNPFYDALHRDIRIKTFSSHQIALCRPSKLGVLASNKSQKTKNQCRSADQT